MLRPVRRFLPVLLLIAVASVSGALEYHDYFVGFGTDLMISADPSLFPAREGFAFQAVNFVATYGPPGTRPVRFRAGIGWFPRGPFRVIAGVEIPLYERLNRAMARGFGIYLLGDAVATIPAGVRAEATAAVLVPMMALGGLRVAGGAAFDSSGDPGNRVEIVFTAGTSTGAYPIRSRR